MSFFQGMNQLNSKFGNKLSLYISSSMTAYLVVSVEISLQHLEPITVKTRSH